MSDTFEMGGGSGKSFSFGPQGAQPGAWVAGLVLEGKEVQSTHYDGPNKGKPEFWDNGDPKMQYRVTLQTELRDDDQDDGVRNVYLDGRRRANDNGTKSKMCAVLDAVRAVTGGTALQRGGWLAVKWVSGMGFSGDPRCYDAQYQAPAMQLDPTPPAQPVPPSQPTPPAQPAQLASSAQPAQPNSFATQQVQAYTQPAPQQPAQASPPPSWVPPGPTGPGGAVNAQIGEIVPPAQPEQQPAGLVLPPGVQMTPEIAAALAAANAPTG